MKASPEILNELAGLMVVNREKSIRKKIMDNQLSASDFSSIEGLAKDDVEEIMGIYSLLTSRDLKGEELVTEMGRALDNLREGRPWNKDAEPPQLPRKI